MKVMYKELDDARNLYNNGFTNGYRRGEATQIAKYMRHILHYGDSRIKTELTKFCILHDPFFRPVPNRNGIRGAVSASKREFRDTTGVITITNSEIQSLQKVKSFKHQKIMISLLVLSKLKKTDKIWISDWSFIRKTISKNITNAGISLCFNLYYEQGLVDVSHSAHTLLFISKTSEDSAMVIYNDNDIANLIQSYKNYCGGIIRYCGNCGNTIPMTSNSRKYCDKCKTHKYKERHEKYNNKR